MARFETFFYSAYKPLPLDISPPKTKLLMNLYKPRPYNWNITVCFCKISSRDNPKGYFLTKKELIRVATVKGHRNEQLGSCVNALHLRIVHLFTWPSSSERQKPEMTKTLRFIKRESLGRIPLSVL